MKKKIKSAAEVKAPAVRKKQPAPKAAPARVTKAKPEGEAAPEGTRKTPAKKRRPLKKKDGSPLLKADGTPRGSFNGAVDKRENEALIQAIETTLLAGTSVSGTCGRCGIDNSTFYRWMKEGEAAPEGTMARNIYDRFTRARAEAEHRNLLLIQRAAAGDAKTKTPGDWRAAAWFLERSFPKEYGVKRIEVSGPDAGPVQTQNQSSVVHYNAPMNDEELEAALTKIINSRKKSRLRKQKIK